MKFGTDIKYLRTMCREQVITPPTAFMELCPFKTFAMEIMSS